MSHWRTRGVGRSGTRIPENDNVKGVEKDAVKGTASHVRAWWHLTKWKGSISARTQSSNNSPRREP